MMASFARHAYTAVTRNTIDVVAKQAVAEHHLPPGYVPGRAFVVMTDDGTQEGKLVTALSCWLAVVSDAKVSYHKANLGKWMNQGASRIIAFLGLFCNHGVTAGQIISSHAGVMVNKMQRMQHQQIKEGFLNNLHFGVDCLHQCSNFCKNMTKHASRKMHVPKLWPY